MEGLQILIVDDEADAGEILCLRLDKRGMKPMYLSSGEEALAYLKTAQPDVVLLDVKMPGIDGIEVLQAIRKDYPTLPVIMLSGHADMEVAAKGLELGAFYYQLKPVDLETLCHKIEDACKHKALTEKTP